MNPAANSVASCEDPSRKAGALLRATFSPEVARPSIRELSGMITFH